MLSERKQISKAILAKYVAGLVALGSLSGCISVQAIEPVINPPSQFQMDATVPIEFVAPVVVGLRCAERGAKFLGLPGLNSGACSDRTLMTFPDPCFTLTAGWYADVLCREITQIRAFDAAQVLETEKAEAATRIAQTNTSYASDAAAARFYQTDLRPDVPGARLIPISQASPARKSSAQKPAAMASEAPRPLLQESQSLRVEFVAADQVMMRCAERGAKFVAGSNTGACADKHLVTIANPCSTLNTGWYGRTLCHEMAHANGWPADHRGGAWLKRLPPILPASESPEAKAYAASLQAAAKAAAAQPVNIDAKVEQAGVATSVEDRTKTNETAEAIPAATLISEPHDQDLFARPSIDVLAPPLADRVAVGLAIEATEASGAELLADVLLATDWSSDPARSFSPNTALVEADLKDGLVEQNVAPRQGFLNLVLKAREELALKLSDDLAPENTSLVTLAQAGTGRGSPDLAGGR